MNLSTLGLALLLSALIGLPAAAQEGPDLAALRAAVEAAPEDGPAWYALGRGSQAAGEHAEAVAAFERSIELGHWAAAALLRAAQSDVALGERERALARIERVADEFPAQLGLLQQIGGVPKLDDDPRYVAALAKAEAARYPCRARPESRQFDFWVGDWIVSNPAGQAVGRNSIRGDLAGCVLRESWTDSAGGQGTSVNFYDPHSERWHQVWTSDSGTVTHYVGGFSDGAMRFHAEGFGDVDGVTRQRRMTFTPRDDGSVRQLIEDSADGETWTTGFDGLYTRAPETAD